MDLLRSGSSTSRRGSSFWYSLAICSRASPFFLTRASKYTSVFLPNLPLPAMSLLNSSSASGRVSPFMRRSCKYVKQPCASDSTLVNGGLTDSGSFSLLRIRKYYHAFAFSVNSALSDLEPAFKKSIFCPTEKPHPLIAIVVSKMRKLEFVDKKFVPDYHYSIDLNARIFTQFTRLETHGAGSGPRGY